MGTIFQTIISYIADNWITLVSWLFLISILCVVRIYQVKWKKAKNALEEQRKSVINMSNLSKENIQTLRNQCDALNDLFESTNQKLLLNNTNIDKEVLDLIYATANVGTSQAKGRVQNVE